MQRLRKYFPVARHQIINNALLGLQQWNSCLYTWSVPRGYKRDEVWSLVQTSVEAGSNTSTVTLRVVRDDKKGSLESETVKYGRESQGTRARERLRQQQ
jgi:hypothetical protein